MKTMKINALIFALMLSVPAFSAEPVKKFVGQDRGDPRFTCEIEISDISYSNGQVSRESLTGSVRTNYSHNGDMAPVLPVAFSKLSPDGTLSLFQGSDDQGVNTVRLAVPAEDAAFERLTQLNIRWLHGDHYHVNTCIGLTPTQ